MDPWYLCDRKKSSDNRKRSTNPEGRYFVGLSSGFHNRGHHVCIFLLQMARARGPSILFFDEIDALMSRRGSASEHEASRRAKTELLVQLDGLCSERKKSRGNEASTETAERHFATDHVMVLATSNTPWWVSVVR